jgi:hypothetical protein
MKFPIAPLLISVGAAAADGWVASTDVNAGRTQISKQRTLWLQGALVAAGLVGEFANVDEEYTEPLMFTGAALFSREIAFHLAQSGRTSPVPAQGMARSFVPAAPQMQAAYARPELVTTAGWAVDQAPGSVA